MKAGFDATRLGSPAARLAASAAELGLSSAQLEGLLANLKGGPLHLVEGSLKRTLHQAAEILAAEKVAQSLPEKSEAAAVIADYRRLMTSTKTPSPEALEDLATRAKTAVAKDPTAAGAWLVLGVIQQDESAFAKAMLAEPSLLDRRFLRFARSGSQHYPLPHASSARAGALVELVRLAANNGIMGFAPALEAAYLKVGVAQVDVPLKKLGAELTSQLQRLPEHDSIYLYAHALAQALAKPSMLGNMHLGYSVEPGPREMLGDAGAVLVDQLKTAAEATGAARLSALDVAEHTAYACLKSAGLYVTAETKNDFHYLSLADRRLTVFDARMVRVA